MVHTTQTDCGEQRFALIITRTPPKWHCCDFWLTRSHGLRKTFCGSTSLCEDRVCAFHNRNKRHRVAILLATNKSDSWIVSLRWCHCEEGLSRWCSDFLRPAGCNRVFSNFFIDITNSICFKWCVRRCYWTCWCKNNCVKVLHTMGKSGRGKKIEKRGWVTSISTAVVLGNTLAGKDGLCHSTCKRTHGWLSY